MVTSAPASQSAAQMSWAEVFEPITTARLPGIGVRPGMPARNDAGRP